MEQLLKMLWPIVLLGGFQLNCFTGTHSCVHGKVKVKVTQSCLILCNAMDAHGIF